MRHVTPHGLDCLDTETISSHLPVLPDLPNVTLIVLRRNTLLAPVAIASKNRTKQESVLPLRAASGALKEWTEQLAQSINQPPGT